ncbi:MAG: septal ring lytic transglycosylase RlpA family protein [Candidatus Puniceispirillaceae bacterium]
MRWGLAELMRKVAILGTAGFVVAGCTTAELAIDMVKKSKKEKETVRQAEELAAGTIVAKPRYKVGDPYNVGGTWYYPVRDLAYDETGIGSWYGDEFAGRLTANGEIFDPEKITAAHKTLPMPSVVRVTNLDNGRSLVVRVNDRGPFVAGRIIDLSRESARLLGFKDQGIAKVRVKVLAEQSLRLEDLAKKGMFPQVEGKPNTPMPEFNAVGASDVTFSATSNSGRSNYKAEDGQSAIDLLANAHVGEVITVPPIETSIWVQVGAFHSETNAVNVLGRVDKVSAGQVSRINLDGQVLHRVRLGPVNEVEEADRLLGAVFDLGFKGARIVVD